MKPYLFIIYALMATLTVQAALAVTFGEGVVLVNQDINYTFQEETSIDSLTVGTDHIIFDNDNLSLRPASGEATVNIYGWTDSNNHLFGITGDDQTINFDVNVDGTPGIINITETYYTESFTATTQEQNFTYKEKFNATFNFKEINGTTITENITVEVLNEYTSETTTTNDGSINVLAITPSEYELRITSDNYNPRNAYYTLTQSSNDNITIYLTSNESVVLQVFEVLDTTNQVVPDAVITMQKQITGPEQYVTIAQAKTDSEGKTAIYLQRDTSVYYRFSVTEEETIRPIQPSGNLWTSPNYFIPGIDETVQIIISLEESDIDIISDNYGVTSTLTISEDNNTVTYTWADTRNSILGARMIVNGRYLSSNFTYSKVYDNSSSGITGVLTYDFPIKNNTIYEVKTYLLYSDYQLLDKTTTIRFDADVIIDKDSGLLYAIFILVLVALISLRFGALGSSILAVTSLFLTNKLGLTDLPTSVITSLIALAIIFFIKVKGDDNR
jgi:hypothetical protein